MPATPAARRDVRFDGKPENEFELESPYRPTLGDPVLLVPRSMKGRTRLRNISSLPNPIETFRMEQGGPHSYRLSPDAPCRLQGRGLSGN